MQSVSEQGIKFKVIQNWVKLGPDTPKEDISQKPTLHSPTLPPQNNKQYSLISVVFAKTSDFGGECLI